MYKWFIMFLVLAFLPSQQLYACVGRILTVGVLDSPEGKVMAEMLSLLIGERTGTTVEVKLYPSADELYQAVRADEVGIMVENTARAIEILGLPPLGERDQAYRVVKDLYRERLNLIWLDPLGQSDPGSPDAKPTQEVRATVLSYRVMTDFPGLPRLLNKLAARMSPKDYAALMRAVASGGEPKAAARAFLEDKKLI